MKQLDINQKQLIEKEIKMTLHASRNCLCNQKIDTSKIRFDCRDGHYGEAFGILRALKILEYGIFGAINNYDTLNFGKFMKEKIFESVEEALKS